ncbi:MAG: hypothetical protein HY657_01415 [Acidobacteria bacterium]|nr:hypothetical protein [Acidobacteriota bacterium]
MNVLFIARHFTYFRNYDAALRELAARGHRIHLAVEIDDKMGGIAAVRALTAASSAITSGKVPLRRADAWSGVARRLRLGLDYLRYLDPFYDSAPLRRVRARDRTPRLLAALADPPLVGGERWRRTYGRLLHALDVAVPPPDSIVEYLRTQAPDVMLITPLVDLGSQQLDYVRAARQLGIPCGLAVWSWDHLSSKALLRVYPDRVFVWNAIQRDEAVRVHRVPADRVVVTGAQCFDHWFTRTPSRTRADFCEALGLPAGRPLVLYVCTALIKGSPSEVEFVREWLTWLRGSDDRAVAEAGVLVRPHPSSAGMWRGVDLSAYGPVAVWGGNPVDEPSRRDYFDSLYHSAAVVGLNTSAFLEAAIVGREVLTVLVPRFHDNQMGTAHFRYLLQVGGGMLRVADDAARHVEQLGAALRRTAGAEHPHRAFLEAFLRPQGLDRPSTPLFVEAVEELRECAVQPAMRAGRWKRAVLGQAARAMSALLGDSLTRSPRELDPARQARIAAAASASAAGGQDTDRA